METFISRLGEILALLIILWIIETNIVRLVMWIKCFKVKECSNRKCQIKDMCRKYQERITDEDYRRILQKIAEINNSI